MKKKNKKEAVQKVVNKATAEKPVFDLPKEKKNPMVRIDASQLKKYQDFERFQQDAKFSLGDLLMKYEFNKNSILQQVAIQEQKLNELKAELNEIHGPISIDLATGEITPMDIPK